ncbi:hypothetical protein Tco_1204665 [Tanacetum coccineum]
MASRSKKCSILGITFGIINFPTCVTRKTQVFRRCSASLASRMNHYPRMVVEGGEWHQQLVQREFFRITYFESQRIGSCAKERASAKAQPRSGEHLDVFGDCPLGKCTVSLSPLVSIPPPAVEFEAIPVLCVNQREPELEVEALVGIFDFVSKAVSVCMWRKNRSWSDLVRHLVLADAGQLRDMSGHHPQVTQTLVNRFLRERELELEMSACRESRALTYLSIQQHGSTQMVEVLVSLATVAYASGVTNFGLVSMMLEQ